MTPTGTKQETIDQVRGLQAQARQYGDEFIAGLGHPSPAPGTVRIGPAPCPGKTGDTAENGGYYVAGGWQLPLATEQQLPTLRAMRDAWQARGYEIVLYEEIEPARVRLEGKDPRSAFTFSVVSTNPPTAVAVRVVSACATPPDGRYPGDTVTIYG